MSYIYMADIGLGDFKVASVDTADQNTFPGRWWVQGDAGDIIPNWAGPKPNVGDNYAGMTAA